jgi:acetoin utilization protein AcuB
MTGQEGGKMYIIDHMVKTPVTITADLSIPAARELINSHNFRHLPVVNEAGNLVGMITDRDLRSAYPSTILTEGERRQSHEQLSQTPVRDIMSREFTCLSLFSTLDDALLLLDRQKIGALPVLDDEQKVVGIFSIRDLMKAYKQLFGLGEKGSFMIEIEDDGRLHAASRIIAALEEHNIRFTRLVQTEGGNNTEGAGVFYVRIHTYNTNAVHRVLRNAGFMVRSQQPEKKATT